MKASIISSVTLAALATAAPSIGRRQTPNTQVTATLQFEIAPDTFTANTDIVLGTQLDTDIEVLSIGLNSAVAASCEARTQSTVVGRFTNLINVNFDVLTQITSISCSADAAATAPSTTIPAPIQATASPVAPVAPVSTSPTATLTLEIMPDTFVQMTVPIGVAIDTDLQLISASIATTENVANPNAVKCEANDNNSSNVAGVFTIAKTAIFNNGAKDLISRITCSL
ncbi:hypothetical protein BLS_000993 [Venturia inaequalis]|uniref:Uncharacterized protein n=1 Tax=Venturia inaequalis TaxID=5025 RepID=A0A8H3V8B9_VENIN|nr:hypothetical protein BLS_000993 [Venturia inaequalis]KAE9984344.1 hypothetical protein EG328_008829 [Venturia inaequalis]KAE9991371.1 hypothetical protein EG327_011747 [Venturia inaequalis]RDI76894.1 hypothetical protein Vi05172_g13103 [Venturia inaequalis]